MLKKMLFQIHWFFGISAGLILSLMGITGAIYSYEQQILKWINPDSYVVQVEQREKLTPAEIYQNFHQQYPDTEINSISIAAAENASSTVNIVKEGQRRGYNILINPYSAAELPAIQGREFFAFIQQLHRNLTVGPLGKQLTGACTLILIFFVLSGLYLRWPKRHSLKQWLFVKPKLNGRNFIWDLHAVVGTWVVIFYLIFAMTGLYWSYGWWRDGMFKVLGVEQNQPEQGKGGAAEKRGEQRKRGGAEHTNQEHKPEIQPQYIQSTLTRAWPDFNQHFAQQYSSVTFELPKQADGRMKLVFVDAEIQHERARNNANYDIKTGAFSNIALYEDKKLNEKIMSSMLPVHRGSFFGPVWQFMAMLASLSMPLFFITGWLLYLKRREQKRLTQAARMNAAGTVTDPNAKSWLIVYASQTGVAEQLAWRTATSLQEAGQNTQVKAIQQLSIDDLKHTTQLLCIVSTYGIGEAPDLARHFEKQCLKQHADFSHLHYAVLALGSQDYPDTYCSFGHRIDQWLQRNAATAMFNLVEVNNADADAIQCWNRLLAQASQLELSGMHIDKTFDYWQLSSRELLNPDSLGHPVYSVDLLPQHAAHWQAGDIAEIQPGNSLARIDSFLTKHCISSQAKLEHSGQSVVDALRYKNLNTEIEPFANLEHLFEQLHELPSREYSIASVPEQQLLRLVVRQQQDAAGTLGLGSGWLTAHTEPQSLIQLRIRTNPTFHLIDDNRPIICIGNGTGIAGLMSLLNARHRQNYHKNWLIFGERQREHDFFFQETLNIWQQMGTLQRLDLAFSRDQGHKQYVQDILQKHADELKRWLEQGAVIYVCGSINGMASGVEQCLIAILGEAQLYQLRQTGRYRRDVY